MFKSKFFWALLFSTTVWSCVPMETDLATDQYIKLPNSAHIEGWVWSEKLLRIGISAGDFFERDSSGTWRLYTWVGTIPKSNLVTDGKMVKALDCVYNLIKCGNG